LGSELVHSSRKLSILISEHSNLVGKVGNGSLGISKCSLEGGNLSGKGVDLVSKLSNSSLKLSHLVGKHSNLALEISNGGLCISESSLKC